jgi:hypothetical protein
MLETDTSGKHIEWNGGFMRSFHPLLLMVCLFIPAVARTSQEPQTSQATAALTNKDIVTMVSAGLSQEIVIAKIKSSPCNFDTAPDTLAEIKKAGVPGDIILVMVEAPKDQGQTVYVNCQNSQREVRSTPFYQSPTLAEVPCGDALIFLGSEKGFVKVRTQQGVVGYVMDDFVSKTKPETSKAQEADAPIYPSPRPAATAPAPKLTLPSNLLRAVAWRAVPWVTTSYYQQPGNASTDCTGSGTWFGNVYQGNTSCTTQYTPAQNVPINWTHFTIFNLVETQDSTLVISCTRNWAFSKCSHLVPGDLFQFTHKGGKLSVTARSGNNKTQDFDFDIISSQPKANQ